MREDQVTLHILLSCMRQTAVSWSRKNWIYWFYLAITPPGKTTVFCRKIKNHASGENIPKPCVLVFYTLYCTLLLNSYPDCKKVLHDASAEHTLEGGQSAHTQTQTHTTSSYRPVSVINCKAVALVCSSCVIIRSQAGTRGPKLEMTSSSQTLQCPVADVSWNWVTPAPTPSPPLSSSTCCILALSEINALHMS